MQGFFSIKATPLGANRVLLEEIEEEIIPALISDAKDWVYGKFEDIRGWSPMEVDNERVVWVRCHGILDHENTRKKTSMDVARILVRTKSYDVFNMVVYASINGSMFHIKVLEEWCGPMHWNGLSQAHPKEEEDENVIEEW